VGTRFSTPTPTPIVISVRQQVLCGCLNLAFEQRIKVCEYRGPPVGCTALVTGFEPVASVAAFRIRDTFRAGLPTFVVRRGVVEAAISANMKIGATVIAAVPKPDSGIRCELDSDVADKALHAESVVQCVCSCQKFFASFESYGSPTHSSRGPCSRGKLQWLQSRAESTS
jgi:hypothetical protein